MIIIVMFLVISSILWSNDIEKKVILIEKCDQAPKIDGFADDKIWSELPPNGDFYQNEPFNGQKPFQKNEVKMCYDSNGLYLLATLYDTAVDSIISRVGTRDEFNGADLFGVYIDPYNDAKTAYGFFVSSAGAQIDMRETLTGNEDVNWDAVWKSKISIQNDKWVVEMAIPWSALRFPTETGKDWAINFVRNIPRYNSRSSWNLVPRETANWLSHFGLLRGLKDIDVPLRLSFMPYLSLSLDHQNSASRTYAYKGGVDMKYGITENTTLDMMLIPDFSQIQSDDATLNLSPFEMYYSEKRPFFTEGSELFSKVNIFYSRRIGSIPHLAPTIEDSIKFGETLLSNPQESQILNTTKISGKTNGGLAYGILHAITDEVHAEFQDSLSGEIRKLRTQAFTHFNVSVFDKSLGTNSYFSMINTHVNRPDEGFFANVSGTEFRLTNKANTYAFNAGGAVSWVNSGEESAKKGFKSYLSVGRIGSSFRWELENWFESDTYNPNHLGFLRANNESGVSAAVHYDINETGGKIQNIDIDMQTYVMGLYNPMIYSEAKIEGDLRIHLRNHSSWGTSFESDLASPIDYNEARVEGQKYIKNPGVETDIWYASDWSKKFASVYVFAIWNRYNSPSHGQFLMMEPRYRFSDRFTVSMNSSVNQNWGDFGYVNMNSESDSIFFGQRDQKTISNTFSTAFTLNPQTKFSIRIRHYWSSANYNNYYLLNKTGRLDDYYGNIESADQNYNAFTLDLNTVWNFAPGSELSLTWKQDLSESNSMMNRSYFDNLEDTIGNLQQHSVILKILWYIDSAKLWR